MNASVLLIEDHPDNQKLMVYLLESVGFHVLVADTGEEGVELARHNDVDLILCDIRMSGIDGLEVARRLKADPLLRRTPLIAVTALTHPAEREQLLAAGFDGYIPKAISPTLFLKQVQGIIPIKTPQVPQQLPPMPSPLAHIAR